VRENGAVVLHRIIRCEKDGTFTLSGDHQYYLEKGVRYDDVKAIIGPLLVLVCGLLPGVTIDPLFPGILASAALAAVGYLKGRKSSFSL
ncbi:MAG: hypothetical protein IJI40_05735, partial [Firmicutes bacterium]|nr:hypothetical protein [Bacillota bacterium]